MNQEYYGSDNAPFADLADATSGIELTEQMVIEAARRIYDNQESVSELDVQMYEAVLASFHNAIAEGLADAVSSGTGAVSDEFLEQLRSSNEVFSTFKVHRMQRDIASQLFTAEGKLKSRSRFVKDVLPVASHHVKAWLRTEYDTAVLRAHQAADWLQFERDKDVLPNLRWMPSTSITPGEDHRVFWNTVLPIEHRFWSVHRPGDRWNCKCRLEATDDAPTAVPMVEKNDKKNNPARGLENNPAKDGHIFSNKHSYFPSSCSTCPYGTKKGNLFALAAKKKGDCYACVNVEKSVTAQQREYYMKAMEPLLNVKIEKEIDDGKIIKVGFRKEGNKHLYADTFGRCQNIQKDDLIHLDELLKNSTCVGDAEPNYVKVIGAKHFYYFKTELNNNVIYLNILKIERGTKKNVSYFVYSVTDNIRIE